jgi:hypothetical protein
LNLFNKLIYISYDANFKYWAGRKTILFFLDKNGPNCDWQIKLTFVFAVLLCLIKYFGWSHNFITSGIERFIVWRTVEITDIWICRRHICPTWISFNGTNRKSKSRDSTSSIFPVTRVNVGYCRKEKITVACSIEWM